MSLDRMAEREIVPNFVPIPATLPDPFDVPAPFQIGNDPLDGALGDADHARDIAHPHLGLLRDAQEDMGVVGEKRPGRIRVWRGRLRGRGLICPAAAHASCGHSGTSSVCRARKDEQDSTIIPVVRAKHQRER